VLRVNVRPRQGCPHCLGYFSGVALFQPLTLSGLKSLTSWLLLFSLSLGHCDWPSATGHILLYCLIRLPFSIVLGLQGVSYCSAFAALSPTPSEGEPKVRVK
jgi:hypothetical protein